MISIRMLHLSNYLNVLNATICRYDSQSQKSCLLTQLLKRKLPLGSLRKDILKIIKPAFKDVPKQEENTKRNSSATFPNFSSWWSTIIKTGLCHIIQKFLKMIKRKIELNSLTEILAQRPKLTIKETILHFTDKSWVDMKIRQPLTRTENNNKNWNSISLSQNQKSMETGVIRLFLDAQYHKHASSCGFHDITSYSLLKR